MESINIKKLVLSAVFLALCMLLPFLTGQIQAFGSMLTPMHIPVLLCGFVCGPVYGAAVGTIAPLMRSLIFGMPPPYPTAIAMAFELCAYGFFAGLLYNALPKKAGFVYASLIASMLIGRGVWGIAMLLLLTGDFAFSAFLNVAFLTAWPGIILQILIIPPIVLLLKRAKVMERE